MNSTNLREAYAHVRSRTEEICKGLQTEDYVVQPVVDVSPPKWHIGHTTWFFETFLLKPYAEGYTVFNADYDYVFNSYYETVGTRVIRTDRGNLSRPTVEDVYRYRAHVDEAMNGFLDADLGGEIREIVLLGLNHEQQHQELLCTDIKYILGHNPLLPALDSTSIDQAAAEPKATFISIQAGNYEVGHDGEGFHFDNELNRHKVYLADFSISSALVTNAEYLAFMQNGGYENFRYWHAEGWDWVKSQRASAPLYWHMVEGEWQQYTLHGLQKLELEAAVCHVNFYEAAAFAAWKELRLPTEAEWEIASRQFDWGKRWEWTGSAYLPYPGFTKAEGAIGEYNGKFMVNQMVLRGASVATPDGHSRTTYRNFFHPYLKWQFTGIRLAR